MILSNIYRQRRLKSACAFTQSLRCPHEETLNHWLSKFAQWRFWSDCANAQADLNLRWAHMSKGTFSDVLANMYIKWSAIWDKGPVLRKQRRPWSAITRTQSDEGFVCSSWPYLSKLYGQTTLSKQCRTQIGSYRTRPLIIGLKCLSLIQ